MNNELQKINYTIESQLRQIDKVVASEEIIEGKISEVNNALENVVSKNETISYVAVEVKDTLVSGFGALNEALQEFCFDIKEDLGDVRDKLILLDGTINEMREIFKRPLDTQSKELRERAEYAYLNGWIDKAEIDLLEAEKKNYQDFIVHHILGNIYYYYKKNYPKAVGYYEKAAKYAIPRSKKHASYEHLCAAKAHYKIGQLSDSYAFTLKAIELTPLDGQTLYNHAKYAAKKGYFDEAINNLRKSIGISPNYLITASNDRFFANMKDKIKKLAKELRDEKGNDVTHLREDIVAIRKEAEKLRIKDFGFLDKQLAEINKLCICNSYFDLLKAEQIARDAYDKSVSDWIGVKRGYLYELVSELDNLRGKEGDIKHTTYNMFAGIITFVLWMLALNFILFPMCGIPPIFVILSPLIGWILGLGGIFGLIFGADSIGMSKNTGVTPGIMVFWGSFFPIIIWLCLKYIIKGIKLWNIGEKIAEIDSYKKHVEIDILRLSKFKEIKRGE